MHRIGEVIMANKPMADLLRMEREEMIHKNIVEVNWIVRIAHLVC